LLFSRLHFNGFPLGKLLLLLLESYLATLFTVSENGYFVLLLQVANFPYDDF